ncbi:PepSY-associated TM helix domain-containing protein [Janthinobacterium sp. CG3]|uniref:PepSY-associated TM helix domain-containing protein n=1 Tax=Janthinobacterium sp. CG3 TaxID=1075768 RepID=UPI003FA56CF6
MHYRPAIWPRWIVGLCAMFMLVSIASGVITHKRIFKRLSTFRRASLAWLKLTPRAASSGREISAGS